MRTHVKRTTQRRVVVCASLRHGSERDFLTGIFRHLDEGHAWKIDLIQDSPPFTGESLASAERGELDGIPALQEFADRLEKATLDTIADGEMTKDLALITELPDPKTLNSLEFIRAIRSRL